MTIKEIYKKFGIPPNLAEHMLTVTKVCLFLKDHWTGLVLGWDKVIKTVLLHDLGNVVRLDLVNQVEMLGKEAERLEYWKRMKREMIDKYGENDHDATQKMLQEIGTGKEIITTILSKTFGNSVMVANSDNWYSKILLYADMRVMPFGISSLEERMQDIKDRIPKYSAREDFGDLVNACKEIEKQIQGNVDIPVSEINNESVKRDDGELLNINL